MHRVHALHGLDLVFVAQAAHGHAQARRMLHGGVEHAVELDVDAVDGLAGGLVVGIQARTGLPIQRNWLGSRRVMPAGSGTGRSMARLASSP
jgi:hypothetical protein